MDEGYNGRVRSMPTTKKVKYRGRKLAKLMVHDLGDWRNETRPATEKDLRLINATRAADCLHEILKREPLKVTPEEPDVPWVMVALREVCSAVGGFRDQKLEEEALLLYVSRHGMDQILEIWGADVVRLKEDMERVLGIENTPGQDGVAVVPSVEEAKGSETPAPGTVVVH